MKTSESIKESDSYNFLLLSLYYYFKKNNYNQTAQKLFQEGKLDSIFKFPQDLKPPTNEKEKMQNEFIEFFYKNSFNNQNFDFLGDFWNKFWAIFADKMMNNSKPELLFNKEQKNIIKQTYFQNDISQNFINEKENKDKNDFLKTFNFPSNISKITNNNNNNINETEDINLMNQKNYNENKINKNNANYYDEDDEEGENDIEKEMDDANDIHFNKENGPNIIKQENGQEMNHDVLGNEYENEMQKNPMIYSGFNNMNNNSSGNLFFNLNANSNSKLERNMSAIPFRKDVEMENNINNNDYEG